MKNIFLLGMVAGLLASCQSKNGWVYHRRYINR